MSAEQVQDFIFQLEGEQQKVFQYLHDLMLEFPEVTCKIRFKIPFYYCKSWICYLNPQKKENTEFAFLRGNELSNDQGILDPRGRKQVAGILCPNVKEIPREAIKATIIEALILDESIPYAPKRKKKQP